MKKAVSILAILFSLTLALYASEKTIQLPAPEKTGGKPLMQCLTERKTGRTFAAKELELQVLSNLLYAAYGINRDNGKHTVPTARNLQDMSVYVAMKSGVYRYEPTKNTLEFVNGKDLRELSGLQSKMTGSAPLMLFFVSDTGKYTKEHDKNFYPMIHTGSISQNVYLYAASAGLSTVVIGLINREALDRELDLPKEHKIILIQAVGYPSEA